MGIAWGAPYRGNHLWGFYNKFPRNARLVFAQFIYFERTTTDDRNICYLTLNIL